MNRETQDRIIRALEGTAHDMGLKGSLPQIQRNFLKYAEQILKAVKRYQGLQAFRESLAALPERSAEEVAEFEHTLRYAPLLVRQMLSNFLQDLPKPSVGAKRLLTPKDAQEVNNQIGALQATGQTLRAACQRMAAQKGVSEGTIRRIWQARGKELSYKKIAGPIEGVTINCSLLAFGGLLVGIASAKPAAAAPEPKARKLRLKNENPSVRHTAS